MARRDGCHIVLVALLAAWCESATRATAQTVADGVYSRAQADRGRRQYDDTCRQCHGADLSGGVGRSLVGETFLRDWSGVTLREFFDRVQSMPPDSPASLDDARYLDVTAYVLQANGFPAGAQDLDLGALERIEILPRGGPQPAAEFSLVQIVGCLSRAPDDAWLVTQADEPSRTKDPHPSTNDERAAAAMRRLGTGTYRLLYLYPSPDGLVGHKVEAKGFLLRSPTDAINVTGLASLEPTCDR